jgi:GTPase SAR1 family protein
MTASTIDSPHCSDYLTLVGNPGAGKSTIANSLLGHVYFQSGTSCGTGLTTHFDMQYSGVLDMMIADGPGLSDALTRYQAATEITKMLKAGTGNFKIVFVITIESGRVRPDDTATMDLVLEAITSETCIKPRYGVIINKVSDKMMKRLDKKSRELIQSSINVGRSNPTMFIHYLGEDKALRDEENVLLYPNDDLLNFLDSLPWVSLTPDEVTDVNADKYKKLIAGHAKELEKLRTNMNAVNEQMKQNHDEYQEQIREMKEQHRVVLEDLKKKEADIEKSCSSLLQQNELLQTKIDISMQKEKDLLTQLEKSDADADQCKAVMEEMRKKQADLLSQQESQRQEFEARMQELHQLQEQMKRKKGWFESMIDGIVGGVLSLFGVKC